MLTDEYLRNIGIDPVAARIAANQQVNRVTTVPYSGQYHSDSGSITYNTTSHSTVSYSSSYISSDSYNINYFTNGTSTDISSNIITNSAISNDSYGSIVSVNALAYCEPALTTYSNLGSTGYQNNPSGGWAESVSSTVTYPTTSSWASSLNSTNSAYTTSYPSYSTSYTNAVSTNISTVYSGVRSF